MNARRTLRPGAELTISEEDGVRYLHFGTEWVQGAMRIAQPYALEIDYIQNMMAWLLFMAPPERVLQLGLGAAALTKFTYRYLPATQVTAVELDSGVIDFARRWFALPADDTRLRVVESDADRFLRRIDASLPYGVIQVDLYDALAHGPVLDSVAFYRRCRNALAAPGILCVNLFGAEDSYGRNLAHLHRVFDGRLWCLPQVAAGNIVALAFNGPSLSVSLDKLRKRAGAIQKRYRLPAVAWAERLAALFPEGIAI